MKRKHAHKKVRTLKVNGIKKIQLDMDNPLNQSDLSCFGCSNEWLPYETANSNETELSAEEQLLKEYNDEHKNQIDLGTVDYTPKPAEKAYSADAVRELQNELESVKQELYKAKERETAECVGRMNWQRNYSVSSKALDTAVKENHELTAKLEVAEAACARLKKRADLAECKFWDAEAMTTSTDKDNNMPTGIELLKAARNVLREFEVKDFDVSRAYKDESYGCPKTIGALVCDIDWYLDDIKDVVKSNKAEQSEDSYVSEVFLKQCNELRAENIKLKEQLEIADKKNEKLVQLMQATPVTGSANRAVTTQPKKTDIIELTVQDILKKHQPKPADYGYVLFGEDNFKLRIFDTQLLPIISALYDELENRYVNYSTTYTDLVKHVCTQLEKNDVIFVDRYYVVRV